MVCRRDYVAFKYFNGANMAACLVERHITGCATKELKTGAFIPEYAGKLNFYLSAVDGIMKSDRDDPAIGLLLCESHNGAVVEFSFKDVRKPIGVATDTVTREMPKALEQEVPSVEDFKRGVEKLRTELEAVRKAQQSKPEVAN
jgi:hypothetical protein